MEDLYFFSTIALILALCLFIIINNLTIKKLKDTIQDQSAHLVKLLGEKKKSEIVTGQVAEKLAPFLKDFNHDPQNIQFLGQPIDFISFEDDKITIIEVKSGNSKLTAKQRRIRDLIQSGKVVWEVYRIK